MISGPGIAGSVRRSAVLEASELTRRIASAVVILPLVVVDLYLGGWWFTALVAVLAAGMTYEWIRLAMPERHEPMAVAASVLAGFSVVTLTKEGPWPPEWSPIIPVLGVIALWLSPGGSRSGYPLALLGFCYVLAACLGFATIRELEDGFAIIIAIIVIVVCTDVGAYAVGRIVGGPKLAPRFSPAKTWSGAIGGMCVAILGILLLRTLVFEAEISLEIIVIVGLLSAVSQLGDLAESALKRRAGAKDSGSLIPGHGGLLDRLDGFLAVACLLFLMQIGGILSVSELFR